MWEVGLPCVLCAYSLPGLSPSTSSFGGPTHTPPPVGWPSPCLDRLPFSRCTLKKLVL